MEVERVTSRKKQGLTMIISNGLGLIVGAIVYFTTTTPVIVPLMVQMAVTFVTSYFGLQIIKPDVP